MNEKRPVLKLRYSAFENIMEVIAAGALLMTFFLILSYWNVIPGRIAVHYGALGNPDSWGRKGTLWILPAVNASIFLFLTLISRVPHIYNYAVVITNENADKLYRNARSLMICIKAEIMCFFTYVLWKDIYVSIGKAKSLGVAFLPVFLIIIIGTLVYFIRKSLK